MGDVAGGSRVSVTKLGVSGGRLNGIRVTP
jgi:hypothetical protein